MIPSAASPQAKGSATEAEIKGDKPSKGDKSGSSSPKGKGKAPAHKGGKGKKK
jgi:hypothetical protein